MAQLYRDTGVVLRVQKLGEADRIITMLTRQHGKIRVVAKGVRRTRSRWGARLEPFNHVDVQCYTGRTLDVVTQAQTVDAFAPAVVADWSAYSCGCAILETADRLVSEEGEPALRVYLLLLGATRALADGVREPALVLDAFLLRAMSHAGWAPSLSECARCAAPGPHRAFTVAGGGMVCPRCRPPGSVTPGAETIALLVALLHGDWGTADASGTAPRREASGLVAAHLQWHLERQLRSLPLVDRRARIARTPAEQTPAAADAERADPVGAAPADGDHASPGGPHDRHALPASPPVAPRTASADSTG